MSKTQCASHSRGLLAHPPAQIPPHQLSSYSINPLSLWQWMDKFTCVTIITVCYARIKEPTTEIRLLCEDWNRNQDQPGHGKSNDHQWQSRKTELSSLPKIRHAFCIAFFLPCTQRKVKMWFAQKSTLVQVLVYNSSQTYTHTHTHTHTHANKQTNKQTNSSCLSARNKTYLRTL